MKPTYMLAGAAAIAVGIWIYGAQREARGLQRGRLESIAIDEKRQAGVVRQRDTVFIARVDTLRRVLKLWDSVRTTDTIPVPVPGKPESVTVYVPRDYADSTISICTRALNSCDQSLRARDSLLLLRSAHIKSLEAMKPKRCGLRTGFGVAGGVDMQRKPNVVLGVTFGVTC